MTYLWQTTSKQDARDQLEPRPWFGSRLLFLLVTCLGAVEACGTEETGRSPVVSETSAGETSGGSSNSGGSRGQSVAMAGAGGAGGQSAIECSLGFAPSDDDASTCEACTAGEYCPGDGLRQSCGATPGWKRNSGEPRGTWDHDAAPRTPCVEWTDRERNWECELQIPGTATTDTSCSRDGWGVSWEVQLFGFFPDAVGFHSEGDIIAVGATERSPYAAATTKVVLASRNEGTFVWDAPLFDGNLLCGWSEAPDKDVVVACGPGPNETNGLRVTRLSWPAGAPAWSVTLDEETATQGSTPPKMQLDGSDSVIIQVESESGVTVSRLSLLTGEYLGTSSEIMPSPILDEAQRAQVNQFHEKVIAPILDYNYLNSIELLHAQPTTIGDFFGVTYGDRDGGAFTVDRRTYFWRYVPGAQTVRMTSSLKEAYAFAFGQNHQFVEAARYYEYSEPHEIDEDYLVLYVPSGD